MATQSIVTEIRRKASGGFETPVKLGAEQRFVGALLNSHNNNLEEQSILGPDCITITWEDGNIKYATKKFYNGDLATVSSDGYYILFETDYSESEVTADFFFTGNEFRTPEYATSQASFRQEADGSYIFLGDELELYSYDADTGEILYVNPSFRVMKKAVLCLRTNISDLSDTQNTSDLVISERVISQKVDDSGKTYVKSAITNSL